MHISWPWIIALSAVVIVWSNVRRILRLRAGVMRGNLGLSDASGATQTTVQNMPMPDSVMELIQQGRQVEAIKALRELTGVDLKDAHTAVKNWRSDDGMVRIETRVMTFAGDDVPPNIMEMIQNGKKIEAIKEIRREKKMSLTEAKQAVDALESSTPKPTDFNMPESQPFSVEP